MLAHESMINHSGADVLHNNILNEATMQSAISLSNSKEFKHEYIMQLNDTVAMAMLKSKFIVI